MPRFADPNETPLERLQRLAFLNAIKDHTTKYAVSEKVAKKIIRRYSSGVEHPFRKRVT